MYYFALYSQLNEMRGGTILRFENGVHKSEVKVSSAS